MAVKRQTPTELRSKDADRQARIMKQWHTFSNTEAYADLMDYCDSLKAMYIKYCEDQAMPSPKGDGVVSLSNDMIASLLQARRGCGMVQTYIRARVDTDVAQPIKPTK